MQKTVREIIEMIDNGELHYNQSTQRKFVYQELKAQTELGKTTKSGSLIYSILEKHIQLPAVYFWNNTDTNQLNIHDGKQRILSLYHFIKQDSTEPITVPRKDSAGATKECIFDGLDKEEKDALWNYKLDIVERSGSSLEEEESFYLINTNSVNLTNYECLSGMLHGRFLASFENYINSLATQYDVIHPVHRGEQAYKFLLAIFDHANAKKAPSNDISLKRLRRDIERVREDNFDPVVYKANELLVTFTELLRVTKKRVNEDRALAIACYIVQNCYLRVEDILNLYKSSVKQINDMSSWNIDTHKEFINAFVNEGLKLDPQRAFSKEVKDILYKRSPRCAHINEDGSQCTVTSYSQLQVDHILAWSKGGRTIIDNAQLLCDKHNPSKGNK